MQFTVILNPAAGHGRAGRARGRVEQAMREAGLDHTLLLTEAPGHAVELAREAASAGRTVVAVGGDGTTREVGEGLVRCGAPVPMGIIPVGTGNDFIKNVGIPRWIDTAVAALAQAIIRRVDYGRVRWTETGGAGEVVFLNAVGAGFDAGVAHAAGSYKHLPGLAAYLAAVPGVLWRWSSPIVRVHADGQAVFAGPLFLVTVANGISSGGGFYLTPQASVTDGELDMCLVAGLSRRRVVQLLPKALRGTHTGEPEVSMRRIRSVVVESSAPLPVHVDGEIVTEKTMRLEIEIVPAGLAVLVPKGAH